MLEQFGISEKVILLEGYFSCTSSSYRERFIALGGDPGAIDRKRIDIVGEHVGAFAPYDLVFVDGDHSIESVYSDLSLLHVYTSESAVIILHDLDLSAVIVQCPNQERAIPPFCCHVRQCWRNRFSSSG